mgnify:FL=1
MVWWFEPVSLVFVIGSGCGAISAFVALACSNMRMSRCKKISCLYGCFSCDRENLSETEFASELDNQHQIEGQMNQPRPRSNSNDNDEPSTQI